MLPGILDDMGEQNRELLRSLGRHNMTATAAPRTDWSKHRGLVILAVGYQWFYNGANFLAFKVAGNVLHPLIVASTLIGYAVFLALNAQVSATIERKSPDERPQSTGAKQQNERADHAGADCSEPALPQGMLTRQDGPNQDGSN
jgi:hypothetical protein